MDKNVTALENAGKKVVVTYDSPMFSIDPRRCIRGGIYWQQPAECIFSEQQLVDREPYISDWKNLPAKRKDVCVFEQSLHLKTDDRYRILNPEGILIYRDDHHLSYLGSDRMAR